MKKIHEDGMAGGLPANAVGNAEVASLGVTKAGKPANFAEPGVPPKQKKKKITQSDAPLNRRAIKGLMGFKEWIEEATGYKPVTRNIIPHPVHGHVLARIGSSKTPHIWDSEKQALAGVASNKKVRPDLDYTPVRVHPNNDKLANKHMIKVTGLKEESKHDVRDVTGKMVHIGKKPVRKPSGKMEMEYPGKSSSSGGGD